MLRASSDALGEPVELADAVHGAATAMPFGAELVGFVDAVTTGDTTASAAARAELEAVAGPAAVVDAAAVLANFEMMTRVADATGAVQFAQRLEALVSERLALGLDAFGSAR